MKNPLLILGLSVCLWAGPAHAEDVRVEIKDYAFFPQTVTVPPGTKITWINLDQDPHTVFESGRTRRFHSGALDTEDSFSFTFLEPGEYQYFCTLHPNMVGVVTVTGDPSPSP